MAKALKIVGIVVAVVAIAATAVVLFGPAGATIAGIAAATIVTGAALASAVLALTSVLVLKPPGFSSLGNPQRFVTNPQSSLPYNIGRSRMSGIRIHAETSDGFSDKTQNDVLGFGVLLSAGGPIQEIESFSADKSSLASYGTYMSLANSLGGSTALSLSLGTASFPGWTSEHKLSGMAHALWMLRFDSKGNQFQAGVPEPAWIGKWAKVYDPRLDSTYPGGSGAHRALNEATYTWSRNPALHALTWCLGRWQNGKRVLGIGAPVENIRMAEFVEAANIADANDWSCGGTVWSGDSKWSVLKSMLQACAAVPTMAGAMIGCLVQSPRVSITTVTKDHLLDSLKIAVTKSRRDKYNAVIPRYRSEAHEWEIISGSPITNSTYEAEDGGRKTTELDLTLVQHETVDGINGQLQVGQLCAYELVNSREAGPIEFTLPPQFIGLKSGDCITLDVPDEGLVNQTVILRSVSLDPASAKISCVAETETASKHSFALGQSTTPPPPFSLNAASLSPDMPSVSLWDAVPGLTADGLPQIVVTGASEYTIGIDVLIRHRKTGAANWFAPTILADPRGTVIHPIVPLESLQNYDVEIAYSNGDLVGPWLALGPETTPDGSIGSGGSGTDGVDAYLHIAYATNADGTAGFSTFDATGKTYIGTYTDSNPTDSTSPAAYTWALFKGLDGTNGTNGLNGTNGINGTNGADGQTTYVHFAYADSADGVTNFTTGAADGRFYIGTYTDFTAADSTNPAVYTWSLFRGSNGANGIDGGAGADGISTYVHIAYSTAADGSTGFSTTDGVGKTYIGTYTDTTLADSTNPALYTWSLIKGEDGDDGVSPYVLETSTNNITFDATFAGVLKSGQISKTVKFTMMQGAVDQSSVTTWSIIQESGCDANISSTGLVSFVSVSATGYVEVQAIHGGTTLVKRVTTLLNKDATPPATPTTQSVGVAANGLTSTSYEAVPEDSVSILANGSGHIKGEVYIDYVVANPQVSTVRSFTMEGKLAYRPVGGSTWTDFSAGVVSGSTAFIQWDSFGFEIEGNTGALIMDQTQTGLTAGVRYEIGFFPRKQSGTSAGADYNGTLTGTTP